MSPDCVSWWGRASVSIMQRRSENARRQGRRGARIQKHRGAERSDGEAQADTASSSRAAGVDERPEENEPHGRQGRCAVNLAAVGVVFG